MAADDGPYAEFNAAVSRKSTREVYAGPLSRLGGDADDVARAIEKALLKDARADPGAGHRLGADLHGPAPRVCPTARGIASSALVRALGGASRRSRAGVPL